MSRATRVDFPGAIYHAMGRAIGGVKAFTEDTQRERFLESMGSDSFVAWVWNCQLNTSPMQAVQSPMMELEVPAGSDDL
jgi:hypothetical protein